MGRSPKLRSRRIRRPCAIAPRLLGALLLLLALLLGGLGHPVPLKIPASSTVPVRVFNDSEGMSTYNVYRQSNLHNALL